MDWWLIHVSVTVTKNSLFSKIVVFKEGRESSWGKRYHHFFHIYSGCMHFLSLVYIYSASYLNKLSACCKLLPVCLLVQLLLTVCIKHFTIMSIKHYFSFCQSPPGGWIKSTPDFCLGFINLYMCVYVWESTLIYFHVCLCKYSCSSMHVGLIVTAAGLIAESRVDSSFSLASPVDLGSLDKTPGLWSL